jgi:light-harvesting protein B-800-850 alpha chain
MIYGKLWCVVRPQVGIPLFLSAVAVGSFAVHTALVMNTTWVKKFLNGNADAPAVVASADTAPPAVEAPKATK